MTGRTVKRRLQGAGDAALASDDGPIFWTRKARRGAERSIPERTANAERKKGTPRLGRELAPRHEIRSIGAPTRPGRY